MLREALKSLMQAMYPLEVRDTASKKSERVSLELFFSFYL